MIRALCLCTCLSAAAVPAQAGDAPDPSMAFRTWLRDYLTGAVRFQKGGRTDPAVVEDVDRRMAALAQTDTLPAAKLLFEAAVAAPRPATNLSAHERIDFQREVQPWRLHAMAEGYLRGMREPHILPWLFAKLRAKDLRAKEPNESQRHALAVFRILAGHPSLEAKLELLRACGSMPNGLRVHAVRAMARDAELDLLPHLLGLLRDREPNVRIAACNAIGTALQPHVDETLGKEPAGDLLAQRDRAISKLAAILKRDKIWQVRSAAAYALATMRCKAVIPALIAGLDAELKRKRDPWAMDVRLHKLLEGLTGQSVARGGIEPWKAFWRAEGASFAVRPKPEPGQEPKQDSRYEKFFDLTIESDRVLFVLDFSGSMAEPVTLHRQGTTAGGAAGSTATKAELVVKELKKLVMALPDGALCNFIVFGEDVRIWRAEGDRPALVRLDDDTRDDLLGNFLDGLRPNGPTNLYDALQAALGFGGRGLYDRYYAAGFDTLYVISDGAPTAGPVTDKLEIRRRVREANDLRKITIHCITFGDKNDTDFLRPMAEENGGRHIHIE
ncbi:MAG TPA: VWA domain-containing protein [bacterium]|nr:VWA domain-containing protein [bacterium]